jgi:hypothetical protein
MSSEKQIAANQRNGRRSLGPRTTAGKATSSRNARRHGLASISRTHPAFAPRIAAIARAICSDTSNSLLFEQALIISETTCVLSAVTEHIAQEQRRQGSKWDAMQAASGSNGELEATHLPVPELERVDRYARRALSRRKRAIERFMAIRNTPAVPGNREGADTASCAAQPPVYVGLI